MKEINNKELWLWCLDYFKQYGRVVDATRFRNDMQMRFYGADTKELFERGLARKLYDQKSGNIIFRIIHKRYERD